MRTKPEIHKFWIWFSDNALLFGEKFENQKLLKELDRRIGALGDFGWEIGPGLKKDNALVVSPGGVQELLVDTQAIIDASPLLPDWEFHSAKPPKQWKLRFQLENKDGNLVDIDANQWRFLLLENSDDICEVAIEAPNLNHLCLSETYERWAAEIALDGVLGERCRLESIDYVTVVHKFALADRRKSFPLENARDHFC